MKKSGKSGGKGIIPLPPGRFFLLTLLFTLLAAAGVRAQNPPVSINAKAITINELFTRIEKQGVYTFAYNNADIDLKRVVTVHAKERPIESIVRECLPEVNVQVSNNKVILTARRSDQSSMPMHKLTGTVTDENGAPVTGATVIVVGTQRGTQRAPIRCRSATARSSNSSISAMKSRPSRSAGRPRSTSRSSLRRRWPWTKWSSSATAR